MKTRNVTFEGPLEDHDGWILLQWIASWIMKEATECL